MYVVLCSYNGLLLIVVAEWLMAKFFPNGVDSRWKHRSKSIPKYYGKSNLHKVDLFTWVTSHIVNSLKLVILCWIPKLIFERRSSSIFFLISIEIKKRVLFRGNRNDAVLGTPDSFSGEIIFIIITRSTSRQRGNFFKTDDDSNSLLRVNFRRRKLQGKPHKAHMCSKIKSIQNLIR